jgi:SAM-dependent methyltransferase
VFREVAGELARLQDPRDEPPDDRQHQRETYERIWTHAAYRDFSPGLANADKLTLVPRLHQYGVRTLLDAGCGSGKLMQKLLTECAGEFDVHGFDIAANCLDPFFEGRQDQILTVGCLWDPADFCREYDAIVCTDVLEHVPTERVAAVLANFRRCARKVCYLAIALFPDGFGPELIGRPLHLTVKRPAWWFEQFGRAGFQRDFDRVECNRHGREMWLHAWLSPA